MPQASKVGKGKLRKLKCIEAVWCYPASYNSSDPLQDDWYRPQTWMVQGKEIHLSRLLTFVGREVPDILKPAYAFGGLSMSQMAKPYVDNWLNTRQSVADLVKNFSIITFKTDLFARIALGASALMDRIKLFTNHRNNRGTAVIDTSEDVQSIAVPLGTLDKLQAQSQEHMASVSGIPIVKLLGIQPAGLNASSEGEMETFRDAIKGLQEGFLSPNLTTVIQVIQISLFGEIDDDIVFEFNPLKIMDSRERAEIRKMDAESGAILVEAGAVDVVEERQRIAADPGTVYAGIDVSKVPVKPITDTERATVASTITAAIVGAQETGIINDAIVLQELANLAERTGVWKSIAASDIAAANDDPPMPKEPEEETLPTKQVAA